jgi:undecaprenyl-diphosphatase
VLRAVTLYGFFSIMLARSLRREWRWLPYSLAALLVGAVALSRLYLGVHWLTDVIGSLMLGSAWVALLGIAYYRHVEQASRKRMMIGSALLFTALAALVSVADHQTALQQYQPKKALSSYPSRDWQAQLPPLLPRFRDDLRGQRDQPLNLVLAGEPACLLRYLAGSGWRQAQMLDWHNLLRLLTPRSAIEALPVLPQVHGATHESAVFSKPLADRSRLVLRLWPTEIRLTPGESPLFVGNVSRQRAEPLLHMLAIPRTEADFAHAFSLLRDDLKTVPARAARQEASRLLLDLVDTRPCSADEPAPR